MGNFTSRRAYPSNDFELVCKSSKELEFILESEFGAHGRGLHEKISSVQSSLTAPLIREMRFLATIRNKLIHERGFDAIPDREVFLTRFELSLTTLAEVVKARKLASGKADGGSSCTVM
jgi:hypothetical protein